MFGPNDMACDPWARARFVASCALDVLPDGTRMRLLSVGMRVSRGSVNPSMVLACIDAARDAAYPPSPFGDRASRVDWTGPAIGR